MAATDKASDDSLYPIAVLIDELKNEDIQVSEQFRLEKIDCAAAIINCQNTRYLGIRNSHLHQVIIPTLIRSHLTYYSHYATPRAYG